MEQEQQCVNTGCNEVGQHSPRAMLARVANVLGEIPDTEAGVIGQTQWQEMRQAKAAGMSISAYSHTTQIRGPAFIRCLGYRRQGLDSWPEAHGTLAHLPALELEDALHGVLIEPEQVRKSAIAERRVLFDHRLDGLNEVILYRRWSLGAAVVHQCS
jgi:hypothetical protein